VWRGSESPTAAVGLLRRGLRLDERQIDLEQGGDGRAVLVDRPDPADLRDLDRARVAGELAGDAEKERGSDRELVVGAQQVAERRVGPGGAPRALGAEGGRGAESDRSDRRQDDRRGGDQPPGRD
jgi:hypothetical protein